MKPKVYMKKSIWNILQLMVEMSPIETNAIGWSRRLSENNFEIAKVIAADYKGTDFPGYDAHDLASPTSVVVDPEIKLQQKLKAKQAGFDLNFHFHSHVNMNVFWSGTDLNLQRNWNGRYLLAIVANKRKEFLIQIIDSFITGTEILIPELVLTGKELYISKYKEYEDYFKKYYENYSKKEMNYEYYGFQTTNWNIQS